MDSMNSTNIQGLHLIIAWLGVFGGVVAGAVMGLFFHKETFLGGYASWPRRMVRLGHIAFFGLAILNFMFAKTVTTIDLHRCITLCSRLLLVATVTMPLLCYLSAFRRYYRHLFFIPAGSVLLASGLLLWRVFFP